MQKWENFVVVRTYNSRTKQMTWADEKYKDLSGPEVLNELGNMGWELTTTFVIRESIEEENIYYMLKRPL